MKSSKPQVHREHSRGNMSAKPLWFPKPLRNESLSRASLLKFYLEVDIHPNRNAITSFPETVEPQWGGGGNIIHHLPHCWLIFSGKEYKVVLV